MANRGPNGEKKKNVFRMVIGRGMINWPWIGVLWVWWVRLPLAVDGDDALRVSNPPIRHVRY